MRKIITRQDWQKYCQAVGDFNKIHSDPSIARSYGLDDVIAPGMFIASLGTYYGEISSVKSIRFTGKIYDRDELELCLNADSLMFLRKGEKVCEINGPRFERTNDGAPAKLKQEEHKFETEIERKNIRLYLDSLGLSNLSFPSMYLASLSGPALLDFGKQKGFSGIHVSQSLNILGEYREGPLEVLIGDQRAMKNGENELLAYNLRWMQGGEIIASGKSLVLPLR